MNQVLTCCPANVASPSLGQCLTNVVLLYADLYCILGVVFCGSEAQLVLALLL